MSDTLLTLLVALAVVAAYAWGRRVGLMRAAYRARGVGPDILVTLCRDGQAPQRWRIARGDTLRMRGVDGTLVVGFAKTRPLPAEVGDMLSEVCK